MESHPFFHFADEEIQVVSLNAISTTKVLGTWTANKLYLDMFRVSEAMQEKTMTLVIQYYILEYT